MYPCQVILPSLTKQIPVVKMFTLCSRLRESQSETLTKNGLNKWFRQALPLHNTWSVFWPTINFDFSSTYAALTPFPVRTRLLIREEIRFCCLYKHNLCLFELAGFVTGKSDFNVPKFDVVSVGMFVLP